MSQFGQIRAFDLVRDKESGKSKGYGFVVYEDSNVTDVACAGLNGLRMGEKTLTVRRAAQGSQQQLQQGLALAAASAAALQQQAIAALTSQVFMTIISNCSGY